MKHAKKAMYGTKKAKAGAKKVKLNEPFKKALANSGKSDVIKKMESQMGSEMKKAMMGMKAMNAAMGNMKKISAKFGKEAKKIK
jgi:hypothetical protein